MPIPRFSWVAHAAMTDANPLPGAPLPDSGPEGGPAPSTPPDGGGAIPPSKFPPAGRKILYSGATLCIAGLVVAFLLARTNAGANVIPFLIVLLSMTAFMLVIGKQIMGLWTGILVNEQNVMSLSRLQIVLWTTVILSGYLTAAMVRVKSGSTDALLVQTDWRLWALMGITTTTLAGSALITDTKRNKDVRDAKTLVNSAAQLGVRPLELDQNRQGTMFANGVPQEARFSDLFQGDELGNGAQIDLAKVQLFYFTVILVFAYAALLVQLFHSRGPDGLNALPSVSEGMVVLLGISHAGYLSNKAVDHTQTKP